MGTFSLCGTEVICAEINIAAYDRNTIARVDLHRDFRGVSTGFGGIPATGE
ncbi:MAG: hypothetical protein WB792_14520 [Desulfobacterales bacterium]